MRIYLDGKFIDKEKAVISVFDHGLLYGDGVFEGIRVYDKLVFRLKEHIDRLYRSAGAIELNIPMTKAEAIEATINTLKENMLKDAYIRFVVTRGVGDLGLDPRNCSKSTVFIITDKISLYPEEFYRNGLKIITAKTRRNDPRSLDGRIKSLNYLNNILGKLDAIKAGVAEAIMLTCEDYVAECTGDNIFIVKNGILLTPPSDVGALEGITRSAVMDVSGRVNVPCHEKMMKMDELCASDEVFLTGSAAEIVPVVSIDGRKIGSGKPGEITLKLKDEFKKLTKTDGVRYAL